MQAYTEFPHVAMPLPAPTTPAPAPGSAASEALLALATPVMLAVGAANGFEDLANPHSLASIGWHLVGAGGALAARDDAPRQALAERMRAMLFDAVDADAEVCAPRAGAHRVRSLYKLYSPEEADVLARTSPDERKELVAVRGARSEARLVRPHEAGAAGHVVLPFRAASENNRASVVLARDAGAGEDHRVTMTIVPHQEGGGKRLRPTVWKACVDGVDAQLAVARLFAPLADTPLPPYLPVDADAASVARAGHSLAAQRLGYDMPAWFAEHVASLAQESLRLHVLVSAAQRSGAGRMFRLDSVQLRLNHDAAIYPTPRAQLRARLHLSSAECICGAHREHAPKERAKGVVLVLSACGMPFTGEFGRCASPGCSGCDAFESATFPGCCVRGTAALVRCEHECEPGGGDNSNPGIFLPLPLDPQRGDANERRVAITERNGEIVCELVACAVALARAADDAEAALDVDEAAQQNALAQAQERVRSLRMRCDRAVRRFEKECYEDGFAPGVFTASDQRARALLAARARRAPPTITATHGHLFPERAKCACGGGSGSGSGSGSGNGKRSRAH